MNVNYIAYLAATPEQRAAMIADIVQQGVNAMVAGFTKNNAQVVIGAGTAYTLTTSAAAIVLGTTSPSLTFSNAGTYLLSSDIDLNAVGATLTTQTATIKLTRTNNTPADLTGATQTIKLPTLTTATQAIGRFSPGTIVYTASANDTVVMEAVLSGTTGAGTVTASGGRIIAVQLY